MNEKLFQSIFEKIQNYLPADWRKMVFFAGYTEGSYSMKFYSKGCEGSFIDCFSLQGITRAKLINTFMDIDKILLKARSSLEGKAKWTIFTLIVDFEGNMQAYFDYANHSEDMIDYEERWKEKYL